MRFVTRSHPDKMENQNIKSEINFDTSKLYDVVLILLTFFWQWTTTSIDLALWTIQHVLLYFNEHDISLDGMFNLESGFMPN